MLIKHESYTHTNGNKHTYIYIYTKKYQETHSHIHWEKITISEIRNDPNTHPPHTHIVSNIKNKWEVK